LRDSIVPRTRIAKGMLCMSLVERRFDGGQEA
jgi:hypothetical protein